MSQGQPVRRIKSGPPWWLWMLLLVVTSVIVIAVAVNSIPEDPREIYEAAKAAVDAREKEAFTISLAKLRRFPEYSAHVSFLDGKLAASETRDLKALELFKLAADNEQLKPLALEEIGKCQTRMGEFKAAITTYEDAIQAASGESQSARISLAQLYYSVGAYVLSEATLGEVIEVDPSNSDALSLRGNIRLETERLNEAVDDLQVILATPGGRASANPKVIEDCAVCLLRLGDVEKLKKFQADTQGLVSNDYLKARLMIAVGELEPVEAIIQGSEAIKSNPVIQGKCKATLALAKGDLEGAVAAIETVFSLVTRDQDAFELAEKIFGTSGDSQKLRVVKENLEKFRSTTTEFVEVVTTQCNNVTDFEARIKAAELQKQLSNIEAAKKWYTMAALLDGEKAQVVYESLHLLYEPLPMFVQFPLPEKSEAETGAADGKSEEPAPKTDAADAEVNSEKTRQLDDDAVEKKEEAAVDSKPEVKEEADTSTAEPAAAAESPKNEE